MARNNEKIWRLIKLALYLLPLIASIALAYGTLRERVSNNQKRIDIVEIKADANETSIIEMRTDIKYIKQGIDEIKQELRK